MYIFHTDSGHGWLAVKRAELVRLGIQHSISLYSYQNGETVYLEEDCDAGHFAEAKKAKGEQFKVSTDHMDGNHYIRNYMRYAA
jgi:hypothetical protein